MERARRSFTFRSVIIGLFFAILGTCVNTYLGINFGMGIGLSVIAILISYFLFSKAEEQVSLKEISIVYLISTSSLQAYWVLGTAIFMTEYFKDVSFPGWLLPPNEVVYAKSLDLHYWILPIFTLFCLELISTGLGLIISLVLGEDLASEERMVFPNIAMSASLIKACTRGGETVRLVTITMILGSCITLFLRLISLITGKETTLINLSPYLPYGSVLLISLNLGFIALGYILSAEVSLSLLASGLFLYLLLLPFLCLKGIVMYSQDINQLYNSLLFNFSISPALGMLLLGGISLSILNMVKEKILRKEEEKATRKGLIELYKVLWERILVNKYLRYLVFALLALTLILAYILNPLDPFPRYVSPLFVLYAALLASFLEFIILTRMAGETGMTMGVLGIMLYDVPILVSGYRGYIAYMALSYFKPSPWTGPSVVGLIKYSDLLGIDYRDIIKGKLLGWVPTFLLSALLTLLLWKNLGFATSEMPSLGLIQAALYIRMLATGSLTGGGLLDVRLFMMGGLLGALLEVVTPISLTGLAMGLLLPPQYMIPIGIGGFLRLYTDRVYGRGYFRERGLLIATGFMASSMVVEILVLLLTSLFK